MALFEFLGFNKLPDGVRGSTLLLADAATLSRAGEFIVALQAKFHNIALAVTDRTDSASAYPSLQLPEDLSAAAERIKKIQPQRLIVLGLSGTYRPVAIAANCPVFWINARDAAVVDPKYRIVTTAQPIRELPDAIVTGDPYAELSRLPAITVDTEICKRFKEQREGDRWLGYFAATGEAEEDQAYALFNRAIRHKMGLMLLAPRDPARCEPVYRESIKYRLQTIRHRRLSTSFVPIKTRVYYIEDPQPLESLYACADFVVAGGTLDAQAKNDPDIVTPILSGKPVIVGGAHRRQPLIAAAVEAGVVLTGSDSETLFGCIKTLIDQPEQGATLAARAREWLDRQVGATARVLSLID